MNKKIIGLTAVCHLLALTAFAAPGLCQGVGKEPVASAKPSAAPVVTIKGKVVYDQRSRNYMFSQDEPPYSELFIMNENVNELKVLAESKQSVKVEGSLPKGAEILLIDKIDGKKFGKSK